jgi:diguanylate cyclase (GGDEF)-like protein
VNAGKVVQSGNPLLVGNIEQDTRIRRKKRPRYHSGSFLIVPLKLDHRVIGVINLADKASGETFTEEDLNSLLSLTAQTNIALQRAELYTMTKELKRISITDPLTRLLNRRYFQERSLEEIHRAQRFQTPLSLAMLDLDDFKSYNDQHGHPAGDTLLQAVAQVVRESVRNIDVVSRYGGEEFAILSPQTGPEEVFAVAERVCEAILAYPFPFRERQPRGIISLSAGVATYPVEAVDLKELVNNADRALYRAKSAGKNRVMRFSVP